MGKFKPKKGQLDIKKVFSKSPPGAFKKQLGIPKDEKIPLTLLNKIVSAKSGDTIKNPTMVGKKSIKVTPKLERRAIFLRTVRGFKKK